MRNDDMNATAENEWRPRARDTDAHSLVLLEASAALRSRDAAVEAKLCYACHQRGGADKSTGTGFILRFATPSLGDVARR